MTQFNTPRDASRNRLSETVATGAALAALPVLPGTLSYLWSHMTSVKEVWRVVQVVGAWPGVTITPNRSGLCIALGGVVLGHMRWTGKIDLRFAPDVGDRLMSDELSGSQPA